MKQYWEVQGPSKAPKDHCLAFRKFDGSNMRFEWSRKRGWYKFGTRGQMIDQTAPIFGAAIPLFMKTHAEGIEKAIVDDKEYRHVDGVIVFCEFVGPNSFAGWHDPADAEKMELILFDVNINKKGFVLPRDFSRKFSAVRSAEVVFEGNFGNQFVKDVYDGRYGDVGCEGIVAKGVNPAMKNAQHGLWYAKAKTGWWLKELRRRAEQAPEIFGRTLTDNQREQSLSGDQEVRSGD